MYNSRPPMMQFPRVARLLIISAAAIPHAAIASVGISSRNTMSLLRSPSLPAFVTSCGRLPGLRGLSALCRPLISSCISTRTPLILRQDFLSRQRASALCATPPSSSTAYDKEQLRLLDEDECILVNEKDEVIGHGSKKFCHLMANIVAGKALHRAFSVFLFNSKGELMLQKRSSDKILFPNRWTNTCCSHPLFNDDELDNPPSPEAPGIRRAVVRKLEHELGIPAGQVTEDSLHYMTRIVYKAAVGEDDTWGEHEVDYILLAMSDVTTDLNPNEVSEIRYIGKDGLAELLQAEARGEVMLSPWFRLIAQRWLPVWWDALLAGKIAQVKDQSIHIIDA